METKENDQLKELSDEELKKVSGGQQDDEDPGWKPPTPNCYENSNPNDTTCNPGYSYDHQGKQCCKSNF